MVNVDTVYKTVLYLLNKQQRGYITPDEFNKTSTQVQLEMFEKYFEDLNQQLRVPQNESEYGDRLKTVDEKISIFKTSGTPSASAANVFTPPTDLHRLGSVIYDNTTEVERVSQKEFLYVNNSPLTKPSTSFPIYTYTQNAADPFTDVTVYPSSITSDISFSYIRKPIDPRWGYYTGTVGQYVYDSSPYLTATGALVVGTDTLTAQLTTDASGAAVDGSYTGTPTNPATLGFATDGSGTGASITVIISGGVVTQINVNSGGSGYAVEDTITLDRAVTGIGGLTDPVVTLVASNFYPNSTYGSTNFDLDNTDQTELILNILAYSGVVIRDPQIVQTATQMVMQEEANQKS